MQCLFCFCDSVFSRQFLIFIRYYLGYLVVYLCYFLLYIILHKGKIFRMIKVIIFQGEVFLW